MSMDVPVVTKKRPGRRHLKRLNMSRSDPTAGRHVNFHELAYLDVDGCACGDEEEAEQETAERPDVCLHLRPVVGLGKKGTGQECSQLHTSGVAGMT